MKSFKRSTMIGWLVATSIMIAMMILIMVNFVAKGRESATKSEQVELIANAEKLSEVFTTQLRVCSSYCRITSRAIDFDTAADEEIIRFLSDSVNNTSISKVVFCRKGVALKDGSGDYDFASIPEFDYEKECIVCASNIAGLESDLLLINVPIVNNSSLVYVIRFEDLSELFAKTGLEETGFLYVASSDGHILGRFEKFNDYESMYGEGGNFLERISVSDANNALREAFINEDFCDGSLAFECTVDGDDRTIIVADTGINDWVLILGVRQYVANQMKNTFFSKTFDAAVKLVSVLVLFVVFAASTLFMVLGESGRKVKLKYEPEKTDLFTGLYNKETSECLIDEYLESNPDSKGILFFLDVDEFEAIIENMGSGFADKLIKELAVAIRKEFRISDIIGRTGNDEFVIFLKDVKDNLIIEREINRINRFLREFNSSDDSKQSFTCSIGAARFPKDFSTYKALEHAAREALEYAKKNGRNRLVFYDSISNKEND